ncbi:MAG: hypothetical protein JNM52_00295, partial [Betaproteobacteria bacterium]|nr:hypothetical protein [Betaproteobacteria bacterium]
SIGSLIKGAAEKLVNKALGRACESIGNAAQTAVGSWNDSIQKINEQFNLNQQVYGAVAGAIGNINTTGGSYTNGSGGGATGGVGGQISTPCIPSVTTLCNPDGSSSPRPKPERPFMCAPAPPPRLGFCDCSDGSHPQMVGGQCPLQPANP